MTRRGADVVIVGGAVMGSAAAHHLARHPAMAGRRIVVIEQDPGYGACATTRSAGGIRQQFSTPECIAMSQATLALICNLKAELGADADVAFREQGYLLLASSDGRDTLARNFALQRAMGADVTLLDPAELRERMPWIGTAGVAAASLGLSGEGWIDPASLLALFRRSALGRSVEYLHARVAAIDVAGSRVAAVRTADGARIGCGALVVAAGPAAGAVARMAGVPLPVEPRKRFVFVIDCRDATEALHRAPLTVDTSGVWFRPEGRRFICGVSPSSDAEEPEPGDLDAIDHDLLEARIWPALAARVPAFAALKSVGAWAGHYDYNTFDQNAVIGAHPEIANLYLCAGFSGHGLQHAAAAGRAVAELIAEGRLVTLDLTRLGYARLLRGEPLREENVI